MPDFVYRKGYPVKDSSGNVLYVQPVRAIQADNGIWYPGVYNPDGYVYNKVPEDMVVSYSAFITSDGLILITANGEMFMVRGSASEFNSIHTGSAIDFGISDIVGMQAESAAKWIILDNLVNRIVALEGVVYG